MIIASVVAISQATPLKKSRRTSKRDIGLKLREEANRLRNEDHTESQGDHTVIYGNGIPGHEAEIIHQEFNRDDYGNYNFA